MGLFPVCRLLFSIVQSRGGELSYSFRMDNQELTPKQLFSVRCSTCGAAAGKRCVLHSGAPRTEPHLARKFSAAVAIERKEIQPGERC